LNKRLVLIIFLVTLLFAFSSGEFVFANPSGGGRSFSMEAEILMIMIFGAAAILAATIGWFWIKKLHLKRKKQLN
jgi:hypothetical protein